MSPRPRPRLGPAIAWLAPLAVVLACLAYGCPDLELEEPDRPRASTRRSRRDRRGRNAEQQPQVLPHPQQPQQYPQPPQYPQQPAANVPAGAMHGRLRVTFLDIGQGDAALLETSDGHAAMIDVGPPEGAAHVRQMLAAHGVRRLDWVMLSHPHLDHIGAAQAVLDAVQVGQVIDPGFPHPIATYDRLLARIQQMGLSFVRAHAGGRVNLGAVATVDVLQPRDPFLTGTRSDPNANSVVARVTAGGVRVLFTGDAERETEQRLLAENGAALQAEVLKVAHHGSRHSSTPAFLAAVSPRFAVISCATGNDYGHPGASTLGALAQRGVTLYRTDLHGDVQLDMANGQAFFQTARLASPAQLMVPGQRAGRSSE